jgi:hypothetical protein
MSRSEAKLFVLEGGKGKMSMEPTWLETNFSPQNPKFGGRNAKNDSVIDLIKYRTIIEKLDFSESGYSQSLLTSLNMDELKALRKGTEEET